MSDKEKRRVLLLLSGVCSLLIIMVMYLTYFQFFESEKYRNSAQNRRNSIEKENVVRGSFMDRQGVVLAHTEVKEDGSKERVYSYPELYAHTIGYTYSDLGKSGLELSQDDYLTNNYATGLIEAIKSQLNKESIGATVHLTLDTSIQKRAYDLLGEKIGAIAVMNPKTGEVYALASTPSFNPSKLREDWDEINQSKNSPLFNRAINGKYPPGSVFKVLTAASLLENNVDLNYVHTGSQTIDGYEYSDATSKLYGEIGLNKAFTASLNTYFVDKVQNVGPEKFKSLAEKFMFDKEINFEIPVSKSSLNWSGIPSKNLLSASSIGQGKVLTTPLEMCMITSAIANEGKMMKPYLVSEIVDSEGIALKSTEAEILSQAISPEVAGELKDLMVDTTKYGTGKNAALKSIEVAGKTGTAENETENTHAWYVGFAPADDPQVSVAIIVEQGGSGGDIAAPIAREIIAAVINSL